MSYFKTYVSNTLAASGNQSIFTDDGALFHTCRIFYKATVGGAFPYSFLFSNTIDSTYADGSRSHKNMLPDSWSFARGFVGICSSQADLPLHLFPLTIQQKAEKEVAPGEWFATDPVTLCPRPNDYVILQFSYKGKKMPCHPESNIPSFVCEKEEWAACHLHPFPSMVGIARPGCKTMAFLGDSITQGIGVPQDSYKHWNARFAALTGNRYAYWNLGLGYGRADDAASDGAWLWKAKQAHIVMVCYGVNDILQGFDGEALKRNLLTIVQKLTQGGCKVILQTIPPFDYSPEHKKVWEDVNTFITGLSHTYSVFDCVECLKKSDDEPHMAKYAGHPNEEGCRIWAEALYQASKSFPELC